MKNIHKVMVLATGMLMLGMQVADAKPKGECAVSNPVIIHTVSGNDELPQSGDSLEIVLIGNIKSGKGNGSGKAIKACNDTVMDYDATSEASESVICRLNGAAVPSKGRLRVSDSHQRLMCTDKPSGNDVDVVRIMASN